MRLNTMQMLFNKMISKGEGGLVLYYTVRSMEISAYQSELNHCSALFDLSKIMFGKCHGHFKN